MIQVYKRDNEKSDALLRRFNRVVQESGLLRTLKGCRFRVKPPTKRERRESAQRKAMIRKMKNESFLT